MGGSTSHVDARPHITLSRSHDAKLAVDLAPYLPMYQPDKGQ